MSRLARARQHERLVFEAFEPRILYSADLSPLALAAMGDGTQAEVQDVHHTAPVAAQTPAEIAFVDMSLPDAQSLIDDLQAQARAGRPIEVVQIAADEDGITRIDATLAGRHDLTAVHVLSHGSDGVVQLGNVRLDAATVLARAGELAQWGSALSADADLLLYGCDVAAHPQGEALIGQIAALTGADVAASDDLTGAASQAANWTLERTTGTIEASLAISTAEQQRWQGTMTLLAQDQFTTSGKLDGQGGGTGWADNWAGSGAKLQVTGSGLTDPTGLLPTGNGSVKLDDSTLLGTVVAQRNLTTAIGTTGTTTWISFLVQPDKLGVSDYAGIQFGSASATTAFAGYSGSAFGVNVAGSTSLTAVLGATAQSGQSYLLVLKLQHVTGNDTITLYVNPTPGLSSPDTTAFVTVTNMDLGSFTRIGLAGGTTLGNNKATLDELRVGQSFADVAPTNVPVITSNGGDTSAAIGVAENTTAVTTVTATDADTPTGLAYSISSGADAAKFSINASTGVLSFITAPNFEAPTDAGTNNVYDLVVRVSDGSHTDTQTLAVTVGNVNEAPIANADAFGAVQDTPLVVNVSSGLLANDSDPEGAALHVSAVGTPTHGTVSLTPALLGTFTNLTNNAAQDTRAAWSPSGTKIAFDSARDGNNEIYVMNADGSGLVRLTSNAADDSQAAWSPDGTKIAFMSSRSGSYEIWVMNAADGSGLTQLTSTGSAVSGQPAWSPDGTKIAFTSDRGGGAFDIYVMNANGSSVVRLTTASGDDSEPAWSPDGTKLAFVSMRDGNSEIYLMNADGSGATRLTNNAAIDRTPAWSPDGTKLLFTSERSGVSQIMVMDASGANAVAVTAEAGAVSFADWSANGRSIVFSQGGEVKTAMLTESGAFVYTPTAGYRGADSFSYTVTDAGGLSRSATVSITVAARPVITSNGGGATAALSVAENSSAVTTVTATDADLPAQPLSYSIVGGADAAKFTINASTGALAFATAPDFEAPADAGANNVYDLTVQVSDGSLTDTQALAVTVTDVADGPTSLADAYTLTEDQAFSATVASGWYDAAWSVRQRVDFNNTSGPTLTDALVLVTLDATTVDYARLQSGGQDLRFVDNDGTVLSYEIDSWNVGAVSRVWVRVPQIDAASASDGVWMYYGNAAAASGQNAAAVWGDAKAVLHLGSTLADSSAAANSLTQTATTVVGGEVGSARSFDGATSFVSVGSSTAVDDLFVGGGSLSAWINPSSWGEGNYGRIASKASTTFASGANGDGWNLEVGGPAQNLIFEVGFGTTVGRWATPTGSIALGSWQQVSVVYDSSSASQTPVLYINGVAQTLTVMSTPAGAATSDAAMALRIGNQTLTTDRTFAGTIDEVRAYDSARTAAQINADFRAATGVLATLGTAQVAAPGVLNNDHPNGGPALTAELVTGPAHAATFTLRADGTFDYTPVADYNGSDSFSYRARSGTALGSVTAVTLNITPVNDAPVITSNGSGASAAVNVAENGRVVTTVTSADVDSATRTYSIVGGADAAKFSINATSGALTFVTAPNFEVPTDSGANNVYDVTVQVSDGALVDSQAIAVTVTNVNEAPIISSNGGGTSASMSAAENRTALTTVAASDVDAASTLTYSIIGGADAARFSINASTGALRFVAAPNFEVPTDSGANNVYNVTVQVSDGALVDTQALAVTVTNVNEAPTITSGGGAATAAVNVAENGTAVATLAASDVDAASSLVWSIVGGTDAAKFTVNATTGALSFVAAPNFELPGDAGTDNIYNVNVQVSDGVLVDLQAIAVTVTNVNEAPTITSNGGGASASIGVLEGHTAVTTVQGGDVEAGSSLTYSIVGGADAAKFTIDAATGALAFVTAPSFATPIDVGADNIYDVTVQVSDSALTDSQAIAVTVSNVNAAPVITSHGGGANGAISVAENQSIATTFTASDADLPAQTLTWSIVGGADAAKFSINASTGLLGFVNAPNFEAPGDAGANNVYEVVVKVSDGALTDTQALAVTVININEAPVISSDGGGADAALSIAENSTALTTVTASDVDSGSTLVYAIGGGVDAALFTVDTATGVLRFLAAPNFEAPADAGADNVYNVIVQVSDGTLIAAQEMAVTVTNLNEAPVIDGPASVSVTENGLVVAPITAADADAGAVLTYSIIGGADQARFSIDAATGQIQFIVAPDFEAPSDGGANNVYELTVQVSDGTLTDSLGLAVTVTNANETPVITSHGGSATASIAMLENQSTVESLAAVDVDAGATLAWSIAGGADSARFTIDVATGALRFVAPPNFELPADADSNNVYDVIVQVSDGYLDTTQSLTVTVGNVDEAPTITTNSLTITESGSAVPLIAAADVDSASSQLVYTVGGLTGGHFEFTRAAGVAVGRFTQADVDTGTLRFVHDGGEAAPGYTLTLDDGTSSTAPSAVTVSYTSVNDAPLTTAVDLGAIDEDGSRLVTAAELLAGASDAEGDALTASNLRIASGEGSLVDHGNGTWTFTPTADWNGALTFDFDLSDGSNSVAGLARLQVNAVNDPPVIASLGGGASASLAIDENTSAVTTMAASTVDTGETLRYVIVGGADAARFGVDATTGALRFIAAPDHERPTDANGDNVYEVVVGVSDGRLTTPQALSITVANVDEAPTLVRNAAVVGTQGVTLALLATDPDTPDTTLVYQATNVGGGHFESTLAPGTAITTFTQAEVGAGSVRFVQDGSGALPSYALSLSDGVSRSAAASPTILIDEPEVTPTIPAPSSPVTTPTTSGDKPVSAPATALVGSTSSASVAAPASPRATSGDDALASPASAVFDAPVQGRRYSAVDSSAVGPQAGDVASLHAPDVSGAIVLVEPLSAPADLTLVDSTGPRQDLTSALRERSLDEELSRLSVAVDNTRSTSEELVVSSTAVSTGLSVGYVLWLARGGVLMASVMSAMPAWVSLDPLPVLGQVKRPGLAGAGTDEDDEIDDDDAVEKLFSKARRAPAAAAPETSSEATP